MKEIRICVLNPNSDEALGAEIERICAETLAPATRFFVCSNPAGPRFLRSPEDEAEAAPGMLDIARRREKDYDVLVLACTRDPILGKLRRLLSKPVLGSAESAFHMAIFLGCRFSLLQTSTHSVEAKRVLIRKYGFSESCASVRGFDPVPFTEEAVLSGLVEEARKAVREDGAEAVVLGGVAGIGRYGERVREFLPVPVIDGLPAALLLAESLARLGLAAAKSRSPRSGPETD